MLLSCNSARPSIHYITIVFTLYPSSIRLWDVAILIPNLLFLGFLCLLFQRARIKLYATNSPIFLCFYGLIWICAIFSVLRSVISMGLSSAHVKPEVQDITNKILWTIVRFVLLTAEISVLIFSLAFGHLESRHSIKAVLTTTGIISLAFSVVQGQWIRSFVHSLTGCCLREPSFSLLCFV